MVNQHHIKEITSLNEQRKNDYIKEIRAFSRYWKKNANEKREFIPFNRY